VEKRVMLASYWSWLPAGLAPVPLRALRGAGDRLAAPWPRLVVACGRRSIGPALAVKRASHGRTIAAYVQNPEFAGRQFDLVVALAHDRLSAENTVVVETALHPVTPEGLAAAAAAWRPRLNPTQAPLLGVLVGGDNGPYRLSQAALGLLLAILADARRRGAHVALTPSRRTGAAARRFLADAVADDDGVFIWNGCGDNPYLGILGLADRLLVTADSVSMISEALATGRPTHILPLEGRGRRHDAFLERITAARLVSPVAGTALDWSFAGHPPISSVDEPARRLRALVDERRQG
jgi:mitochondrial fission protein ELM1